MLSTLLLAQSLSINLYATYTYFILTANMITTYAAMGIGIVAARSYASLPCRPVQAKQEIFALWLLNLAIATVVTGAVAADLSTRFLGNASIPPLALALLILPASLATTSNAAIQGLQAFRGAMRTGIAAFCILVGASLWASKEHSLLIAIAGLIGAQWLRTLGDGWLALEPFDTSDFKILAHSILGTLKAQLPYLGSAAGISILAGSSNWIAATLLKLHAPPL